MIVRYNLKYYILKYYILTKEYVQNSMSQCQLLCPKLKSMNSIHWLSLIYPWLRTNYMELKKKTKLCFALLIQNADAMASFQKDSSRVVTLLLHARNFVSHVVPLILLNTKVFLQHHFVFLFSEAFEVILFIVTIFAK